MTNPEIDDDGDKCWYNAQGQLHRDEGPAIEWFDGAKDWYQNDLLHREDGPACEWPSGYKQWYIKGKLIT
jgi:hypothetical protein